MGLAHVIARLQRTMIKEAKVHAGDDKGYHKKKIHIKLFTEMDINK